MKRGPIAPTPIDLRLHPCLENPMKLLNWVLVLSVVAAGFFFEASPSRAGNVLEITDGDATPLSAAVLPGDAITLLVLLTGEIEIRFDTFLFDVVFSVPGLHYQSYEFDGTVFRAGIAGEDFSVPGLAGLPRPPASHLITAASFTPSPNAPEVVDVHLEAVSALGPDGEPLAFGTGVLARLRLSVPSDFDAQDVRIEAVPDTFSLGMETVDTLQGEPLRITVAGTAPPSPTPDDGAEPTEPIDPAPSPPDLDGDAVADEKDACPDTPPGAAVDEEGCPTVPPPPNSPPTDSDGDGVDDEPDSNPDPTPGPDSGESPPTEDPPRGARGFCGAMGMLDLFLLAMGLTGLGRTRRAFFRC